MAVMKVYDKDGCVGCPPEMGCLGQACLQCWYIRMTCDVCGEEVEELHRNIDDKWDLCEECYEKAFALITGDNAYEYCD